MKINRKVYSLILFGLLVGSLLFSLPFFSYSVPFVFAANPSDEFCYSNSEFAQNVTIGFINASVSDGDGYADIFSVVIMVETQGAAEVLNITWLQADDSFSKTSDTDSIGVFLSENSESSTFGTDYYNVSFSLAFVGGTTGECNVTVEITDDSSNVHSEEYADQFFLSDFNRATGIQWYLEQGYFSTAGWDYAYMSDVGDKFIISEQFSRDILTYDINETLIYEYDMPNSTYGYYSALSGDGKYVAYATAKMSAYNTTLYDADTGEHIWSYYDTGESPLGISINYNASIIAVITAESGTAGINIYNFDGWVWKCSQINGQSLPTMYAVSVSRNGGVIAASSSNTGVTWPNSSVFAWEYDSSTPLWSFNFSLASNSVTPPIRVTDDGKYIVCIDGYTVYGSNLAIFDYDDPNPILYQNLPYIRCNGVMMMDIAYESNRDSIYIAAVGDRAATHGNLFSMQYNITADTFHRTFNFTVDNYNWRGVDISQTMQNDRYYISMTGDYGTYYFNSLSNDTLIHYYNATHSIGYSTSINRAGNRFVACLSHTVDKKKYTEYYSYGDDVPFVNLEVGITNMEDDETWVFANERFYHYYAKVQHIIDPTILDTIGIKFSDGEATALMYYDNQDIDESQYEQFSLSIAPQYDPDYYPFYLNIESCSVEVSSNGIITVYWDLWVTEHSWDIDDVDLYIFSNDTSGNVLNWELVASGKDLFNIYVVGGRTFYDSSGDAGIYASSVPFEVFASNNSWVEVEIFYRKLQHTHFEYGIWIPDSHINDDQNYTLELGMDFLLYQDENWYKGWKTQIQSYGGGEIATGNNLWINYTVEHYRYNPTGGGTYEPMKQGKMYAYWEGFNTGRDYYKLYSDLWFSSANKSRMWGARVNSEYFGMKNNALFGLGWLFGNNWMAMQGNYTDLSYKDELREYPQTLDAWGDIVSTKEIIMCRFWMNLSFPISTVNDYYVRVQGYGSQDFNRMGEGDFVGIDDPPLVETRVPNLDQGGGLFGSLASWLWRVGERIAGAVIYGTMEVWKWFVTFMDSIAAFFGWDGGFSYLVTLVQSFAEWMVTSFLYLGTILVSWFTFIGSWMSKFLTLMILTVTSWVSMIQIFFNYLDGLYTSGFNFYDDYLVTFLPLLPVGLLIWEIMRIDDGGFDALITDVGFMINLGHLFISTLISIIELFFRIIGTLIESIPVIE